MKLIYAYHSGANCKYFETLLSCLESKQDFNYRIVRPSEFLVMDLNPYDVLVYQTFPDYLNLKKFHPPSIEKLDKVFLGFKGYKILLDSFDMGSYNAYARFGLKYPRIKHTPSHDYLKLFNVISILITTGWSHKKHLDFPFLTIRKDIPIHCAFTFGVYPHTRREQIMGMLRERYPYRTSFERIPMAGYELFLRRVQISVIAGGFGETSGSIYPALKSGSLLFVYEHIRKIKSFPYSDLIDGEDYVSFNLENFSEKMDWILQDEQSRIKISLSGQRKFIEGFDPERSADDFFEYLKKEV